MPRQRQQTSQQGRTLCIFLALVPLLAGTIALVVLIIGRVGDDDAPGRNAAAVGTSPESAASAAMPTTAPSASRLATEIEPPISGAPFSPNTRPTSAVSAPPSETASGALRSPSQTRLPTASPTPLPLPNVSPTVSPTAPPSVAPVLSASPTMAPIKSTTPTTPPTNSPMSSAPTTIPTMAPIASTSPTMAPTRSPISSAPTITPTGSPVSASPTMPPTRAPASTSPTRTPTKSPASAAPTRPPTRPPTRSPTRSPVTSAVSSSDQFPYPLPAFRYREWSTLDETRREIAAEKLHYTPISWNVGGGGANPIEKKVWDDLDFSEYLGAVQLGFSRNTWDCYMDHYRSLTWDELRSKPTAYRSYLALGWTPIQWDGDAAYPASEDRWWGQLADAERAAANGLCYFEANWNGVDMNPNPSFFPHPVPAFRYVPFGRLSPPGQRAARSVMGYTATSWNLLHSSSVEWGEAFYDLSREQRGWATTRGLYAHTWNCHINHFNAYSWSGFYGDFKVAVEALGWTAASWDAEAGSAGPASEDQDWIDLSPRERAAATMLCYFAEAWDGVPITEWFDGAAGASAAVSPDGPLPAGIDMSLFAEARRGPRGDDVFH